MQRLVLADYHAVECALMHLAHAKPPADPKVRKLGDEHLESEATG